MQKELTIVSFHETYSADSGSHTIYHFGQRVEAMKFIIGNLEDTDEYHKEILEKDVTKQLRETLMLGKSGRFEYTDGDHDYSIAWDFVPWEYRISDEELLGALDGYVNSNRSDMQYAAFAETVSRHMHRYCQNELFKLISHIIHSFAKGEYDNRNVRARNHSVMIAKFMDEYNL